MLTIITAFTDKDQIIGKNGELPWYLPEDLRYFKQITECHNIVMGRKTFESLPKILPNRHHYVLTRDMDYTVDSEDVTIEHNVDKLFKKMKYEKDEYFIIGGAEIYKKAVKYANKIHATVLYENIEGDTTFPEIPEKFWKKVYNSEIKVSKTGIIYSFLTYERSVSI